MSHESLIPRGNPLTEVMELTASDGVSWVAYIDGLPPARARRLLERTVLPGRRLRFDSAMESRVSLELPAGSPFLAERRLLGLLGGSRLLPEVEPPPPSSAILRRQRWQATVAHIRALRARGCRAVAGATHPAVDALVALLDRLANRRLHHRV
jgi:hypothetical protein